MAQNQVWTIYAAGKVVGVCQSEWEARIFMRARDRHCDVKSSMMGRRSGPPLIQSLGDREKFFDLPLGVDSCRV